MPAYSNVGCLATTDIKVGLVTYFAHCEALAVNNVQMSEPCKNKSAHHHNQSGWNYNDNNDDNRHGKASAKIITPVIALPPSSCKVAMSSKLRTQLEDLCPLHNNLGECIHTWGNCVFREAHAAQQEASRDSP